mgnify:CR=1 FL=1
MDSQQLQPFVIAIKESPEDPWAWMQLGDAAKLIQDWNISLWSYLAALLLLPDDESIKRKFIDSRENILKAK